MVASTIRLFFGLVAAIYGGWWYRRNRGSSNEIVSHFLFWRIAVEQNLFFARIIIIINLLFCCQFMNDEWADINFVMGRGSDVVVFSCCFARSVNMSVCATPSKVYLVLRVYGVYCIQLCRRSSEEIFQHQVTCKRQL